MTPMFIVTVDFEAHSEYEHLFREALVANAQASLRNEEGCRQFDVAVSSDQPHRFFLYEVYADRAAFEAHLASTHYAEFAHATITWVRHKAVRILQLLQP
jgi:(4S)-4-hydroxy-5-phosphonooxypentane-2,3-dione isomerase